MCGRNYFPDAKGQVFPSNSFARAQPGGDSIQEFSPADPCGLPMQVCDWVVGIARVIIFCVLVQLLLQNMFNLWLHERLQSVQGVSNGG